MSLEINQPRIAKNWHRLFAFTIDLIVLGLAKKFLLLIFVQMNTWSYAIDIVGVRLYFGIFNSCLGQTLGKRLFNLMVVNENNQAISFR